MLTYRVNRAERVVEISGAPGDDPTEADTMLAKLVADPDYQRGFGVLRDRRRQPPLSSPDIHRHVATIAKVPEMAGSRWAVLVDDLANFGTMRMAGTIASWNGILVRVFSDEAAARRWLALEPVR